MRSGDRSQGDASRAFGARKVISSVRSRSFSRGGQELGDELGEGNLLELVCYDGSVGWSPLGVACPSQLGAGLAVDGWRRSPNGSSAPVRSVGLGLDEYHKRLGQNSVVSHRLGRRV